MRAEQYIDALAESGKHYFTTAAATAALGGNDDAVRAQLRRLKRRGRIASPMRSFHIVVPPEFRRRGCLPAEHFIDALMEHLGEPYYVALLSAAERYGAAHQRPQFLQVMVAKNRPMVECGDVRVRFIARGDIEQVPVRTFNTPYGYIRYATPEMTALELVGYPQHAGGINNVATVLDELSAEMDEKKLVEAAALCPVGWAQRLGYLLELLGEQGLVRTLELFVRENANSYIPLRRADSVAGAERVAKWKVIVNVDVEPDL